MYWVKKRLFRSKIRLQLRLKFGPDCFYCGCQMDSSVEARVKQRPNAETIEHLWSRLQGRKTWNQGDKVLACYECNHTLGHILDSEQYVERRLTMRKLYKFVLFSTSKRSNQWFWKRARRTVRPLFFKRSHLKPV